MPRVSDAHVKEILSTTIDTTPFIRGANLLVDKHLLGQGLTEPHLMEIERWLAAHLACVLEPQLLSLRTDDTTVQYEGEGTGQGLMASRYGRRVMLLDPTGRLQLASTARRAFMQVH